MRDDVKYLGLSKESFLNLKIIPCDIYKEEEESIVKISSKGDNVSEELFDGIEDVLVVVDDGIDVLNIARIPARSKFDQFF